MGFEQEPKEEVEEVEGEGGEGEGEADGDVDGLVKREEEGRRSQVESSRESVRGRGLKKGELNERGRREG